MDSDPLTIEQVERGPMRGIFASYNLFKGRECNASNYIRAKYTLGKELIEPFLEVVRFNAERCDSLKGFFLNHSLAGATGSGFTALLAERLSVEFPKKIKINETVFGDNWASTQPVVEPYNSLLGLSDLVEHSDMIVMSQNAKLN